MNSEQPILVCTVAFVILCFQLLFTLTGAALAAAGALAAWVSFSPPGATVTYGFFASSITFLGQTTNSITAPVGQYGAAAALLLLGGNLAVIYFIALVVKVWIVCRVNQSLVNFGFLFLASLAFVCTFLGTILGGGGPGGITEAVRLSLAAGSSIFSYGAGFACAIAATFLLALALGLEVYNRAKPFTVYLFFLLVLSLAGFVLAAVSAFGGWASVNILGLNLSLGLTTWPASQWAGALAMLILGFLFGYFHFLAAALKGPFPLTITLSALAFVFTFIGTVLGSGGPNAVTSIVALLGSLASYGPAFGCAIVAVIVQFTVLALEVVSATCNVSCALAAAAAPAGVPELQLKPSDTLRATPAVFAMLRAKASASPTGAPRTRLPLSPAELAAISKLRFDPAVLALLRAKGALTEAGALRRQVSLTPAELDLIGMAGYSQLLEAKVLRPGKELLEEGEEEAAEAPPPLPLPPALRVLLRRKGALSPSGALRRQVSLTATELDLIGMKGYTQLLDCKALIEGREVLEVGEVEKEEGAGV